MDKLKKFNLKVIIIISIISLLFSGCSKSNSNDKNSNNSSSTNSSNLQSYSSDIDEDSSSDVEQQNNKVETPNASVNSSSNSINNNTPSNEKKQNSDDKQNATSETTSSNSSQVDNNLVSQKISISIDCINASNAKLYEKFSEKVVPKNGIILKETFIDFKQGQSAYDVLKLICRQNNIILSVKGFGEQVYIAGINGLKEFDGGQNSGWLYTINGKMPEVGVGSYKLEDGDKIQLRYTVNIGDV